MIGDNPPASAAWGYCERDYPREAIVSPYPFETAEAHYEALLAETRRRGGPTEHTYATVPGEWTGIYRQLLRTPRNWYWFAMEHVQASTILSLLTPEYQTRDAAARSDHGRRRTEFHHQHSCRARIRYVGHRAASRRGRAALVRGDDRLLGRGYAIECLQTFFPIDGTATPVAPGSVIECEVPDMYGGPWAQLWEKDWEQDIERPSDDEDLFSFD
jgi:hypothetical protein